MVYNSPIHSLILTSIHSIQYSLSYSKCSVLLSPVLLYSRQFQQVTVGWECVCSFFVFGLHSLTNNPSWFFKGNVSSPGNLVMLDEYLSLNYLLPILNLNGTNWGQSVKCIFWLFFSVAHVRMWRAVGRAHVNFCRPANSRTSTHFQWAVLGGGYNRPINNAP